MWIKTEIAYRLDFLFFHILFLFCYHGNQVTDEQRQDTEDAHNHNNC